MVPSREHFMQVTSTKIPQQNDLYYLFVFSVVSGVSRTKIGEFTLDALRTRQSLVKGERLVRHEMRAVLLPHVGVEYPG